MTRVDAIIVGAGPAGLLVGSELTRSGFRVAVLDPRAGVPGPQAAHVHLLSDSTWAGLCRLLPGLERRVRSHGAPFAPLGAAMLDGTLSEKCRVWPDREQLDRSMLECATREAHVPVLKRRAASVRRRRGLWQVAGHEAEWLIDASGGSRATLRAASRFAPIDWLEWGRRRGYASVELEGVDWPEGRIGHGWRDAAGDGLVLRRIAGVITRATLQLVDTEDLPGSCDEFAGRATGIMPSEYSRWLFRACPVTAVRTWKSRRSSSVLGGEGLRRIGWMAVGDALLTTAPHQGQGLAQIVDQVEGVRDLLDAGLGLDRVAERLGRWTEQRALAATLSEQLGPVEATAA